MRRSEFVWGEPWCGVSAYEMLRIGRWFRPSSPRPPGYPPSIRGSVQPRGAIFADLKVLLLLLLPLAKLPLLLLPSRGGSIAGVVLTVVMWWGGGGRPKAPLPRLLRLPNHELAHLRFDLCGLPLGLGLALRGVTNVADVLVMTTLFTVVAEHLERRRWGTPQCEIMSR